MNEKPYTDPELALQVRDIKEHLLTLNNDELIDAQGAIESAMIGENMRALPDFLRGKSLEAIARARKEIMETFCSRSA